jgi:hypothetical protein
MGLTMKEKQAVTAVVNNREYQPHTSSVSSWRCISVIARAATVRWSSEWQPAMLRNQPGACNPLSRG